MLKNTFCALAVLALSVTPAVAQTMDVDVAELGPAIWMLEDEDNKAYILGTIHLLSPETQWRTRFMDQLLTEVDQVWFEADVASPEATARMQALVPQLGLNPQGVTLSSMMSEEGKANLATLAERLGAPPAVLAANLDPLKPWLASVSLAQATAMAAGFDASAGVETVLMQALQGTDVDVQYFETAEQQLGFFANLPMDVQVRDFESSLLQSVQEPGLLQDLANAWATGDVETIDQLINHRMKADSPELYQVIIANRNIAWADQIDQIMMGDQDVLIAVGVGHLPGEEGLAEALRNAGYGVRQIQ